MSPELRVALTTLPLTRQSLREIGALLPPDDAQLLASIAETTTAQVTVFAGAGETTRARDDGGGAGDQPAAAGAG